MSSAGVVATAVAWHQYRQWVIVQAGDWPPWATHTATAIAAASVPAVIWLTSDRLARHAESEIADELRLQSERIDASINERFGGISGNLQRVTVRLDENIAAVYGLQTRLAVVETGLAERAAADGYELLVTTDQNLRHQQNLGDRQLAIMVPLAASWEWQVHWTYSRCS